MSPNSYSYFFMEILNRYFSSDSLIRLIVKYRISVATKRHDIHFFNNLTNTHLHKCPLKKTERNIDKIILDIVPRRKDWITIGKGRVQYKSSTARNVASLERTIYLAKKRYRSKKEKPALWFIELTKYLFEIRETLANIHNYSISKPNIIPEKKKKGNSKKEREDKAYRPLAHFKLLKDKILIGQAAKYLTDLIDHELCHDAVFAFRSKKKGRDAITHHDAIAKIKNYVDENSGKELWVAECDIKKFYDCVNHNVAIDSLNQIINRVEKGGYKVDSAALKIFELYLESYSFLHDVYPENEKDSMKKINGEYEWEKENLIKEFYTDGLTERIGVPQGGAISCLIANVVMDKVDRAVLEIGVKEIDKDLLYVRYCDDMVIIHTSKEKCEAALKRYQDALKECKLLCHDPLTIAKYDRYYFDAKSKSPYKLTLPNDDNPHAPWLAFVGYQVKYDGLIRIRKKSLLKESDKQQLIIRKALRAINYKDVANISFNARRTPGQILFRIEQRLISMSVGRVNLHSYKKVIHPQLSWTVGFKKLSKNNIIEKQLKELDRRRTNNLKKLSQKLKRLKKEGEGEGDDIKEDFFGSPFSYHNFILKK